MFELLQSLLHLDQTLTLWLQNFGVGVYVVLFLIIFCETGLVVMPFLPGDSLLFAAGALSAIASDQLEIQILIPLLILASLMGDNFNYVMGRKFGRRLFVSQHPLSFLFSEKNLKLTESFYQEKGKWAVSLARFFPIIRTFAPFVAGVTKMPHRTFLKMSFLGTLAWVNIFVLAGFFFGQIPFIKNNFTALVMGIVGLSLAPFVLAFIKNFRMKRL